MQRKTNSLGFITILTSLILIAGCTILVMYHAKSVLASQRILQNEIRLQQAKEAAQAGLSKTLTIINQNVYKINHKETYELPNHTRFITEITNPDPRKKGLVKITSTGVSIDHNSKYTMSELTVRHEALSRYFVAPLTAKSNTALGGNSEIINPHNNTSIWTGGTISYKQNGRSCVHQVCSNKDVNNRDAMQNDLRLKNMSDSDFFTTFFSYDSEIIKRNAHMKLQEKSGFDYSQILNGAKNKIIYIDPNILTHIDFLTDAEIGTPDEPVILIIKGSPRIKSNLTVNGFVYIDNHWHFHETGNLNINGSIVINGSFSGNFNNQGSIIAKYNPKIMLNTVLNVGFFTPISGSWKDFKNEKL